MQRRAAAMYVILFIVIAVGALSIVTFVDGPNAAMDEYDHQVSVEETFTVDGTEYRLNRLTELSATFAWTDPAAEQNAFLDNESTIESDGVEYRLTIPPDDDPDRFTLTETFPDHDLETIERDGVNYVVIDEQLVREDEYLLEEYGPREEREFELGDTFVLDAENATVTVESISPTNVEVTWVGEATVTMTVSAGEPFELADTTYVANFVDEDTLQLTTDVEAYEEHADRLDTWDERYQGFWGIGVLSIIAAILISGLSFLPRRR